MRISLFHFGDIIQLRIKRASKFASFMTEVPHFMLLEILYDMILCRKIHSVKQGSPIFISKTNYNIR